MTNGDHPCIMKEDVQEMTTSVKDLSKATSAITTEIALVKKDIADLKEVTVAMSQCVKTLTEASIVGQQNNITREQFYKKLDEIMAARQQAIDTARKECTDKIDTLDKKVDAFEKKSVAYDTLVQEVADLKKWFYGIVAVFVIAAIFEIYRVVVLHAAV